MLLRSLFIFLIRSFGRGCHNVLLPVVSTGVAATSSVLDSFSRWPMYLDHGADVDQGIDSCRASVDVLRNRLSLETEEQDSIYRKPRQEVRGTMEMLSEFGLDESVAESRSKREQKLEAQSLEEMERTVQIRVMVVEAVWKGVVRAVEEEASKAVEVREAHLLKVTQEMQDKDSIINNLIQASRKKDEELVNVEEIRHYEIQDKVKEGKDRILGLFQAEVELLNCKIQELTSAQSILIEDTRNYKAELEDQHNQVAKQESVLHDTERCCEMLLVVAKHLQDRIAVLNSKLLKCEDAAQLVRAEIQEQKLKHEAEITVIMTTLEGRVMDLEIELPHLAKDVCTNQIDEPKSWIRRRMCSELKNLPSSKGNLESKLEDTQAAMRNLETSMREEQQTLADKTYDLRSVESGIAVLEHKLVDIEGLPQMEEAEMKRKVPEVDEQLHRKEQENTLDPEQEHKAKHFHLETSVEKSLEKDLLEEKVWMIDTEKTFISSYMEAAFQDLRKMTTHEIMSVREGKGKCPESPGADMYKKGAKEVTSSVSEKESRHNMMEHEFSKAQAGSTDQTSEAEELKADVSKEHSRFEMLREELEDEIPKKEEVTELQEALEESSLESQIENLLILGYAEGLCQHLMEVRCQLEKQNVDARNEIEDKSRCLAVQGKEVSQLRNQIVVLESELPSVNRQMKVDASKDHRRCEMLQKELEDKLARKEEEVAELQDALEESTLQRKVEDLMILGYGEGLSQQMMEIRDQLERKSVGARNVVETKSMTIAVLEKEVCQLRNQILLLEGELSSVNRHVKGQLEAQTQTVITSMQRLEVDLAKKLEHFVSRLQQGHGTLKQMKAGFEGQLQTVVAAVQRLEGDLASKVKIMMTSVQRLEVDLAEKVEQFVSRLQQAHETLKQVKTRFERQGQTAMACVQRLEEFLVGKVENFDSRLQHAYYALIQLSHRLRIREAEYAQTHEDLQKAETEVDFLGDEVDGLMDLLDKVYAVLNHYHPVIQLYPGLAELSTRMRQEVLHHGDGSI